MGDWYEINGMERVFASEMDHCIVGACNNTAQPIYSMKKMVKHLQKTDGMNYYDAIDFINYNFIASVENGTKPIMMDDLLI